MTENNFEGLPDIIKDLASSPEIADIIKNAGLAPQNRADADEPSAPSEAPQASGASGMSIPPDLMAKLPQIVSALKDSGIVNEMRQSQGTTSSQSPTPDMNDIAGKLPQVMSALSGMSGKKAENHDPNCRNRKALLCALKPYMSDRKRSAIDTMLSVDSMAEILMMMMGGEH